MKQKPAYLEASESYVDSIFGPGQGQAHSRFLEAIENKALREMVHRFHLLESDTAHVSLEENYMIGMCVLCATGHHGTACMFAKLLRHLGTPKERILEAVARLSMWVGGLPAVESSLVIQRAVEHFDEHGLDSLSAWFPTSQDTE